MFPKRSQSYLAIDESKRQNQDKVSNAAVEAEAESELYRNRHGIGNQCCIGIGGVPELAL